jgi:hypothetical protein
VSSEQPPGWYPDPGGQRILHWWDGQRWTGDMRPPAGEGGPLFYRPRQSTFTPAQQQPTYPQQPAYPGAPPQHHQQPAPDWRPNSQQPLRGPLELQDEYQPPPGQPPYPPQWQPYAPPPQAPPPRRKRHLLRNINAGLGALIVLLVVIILATNKSNTPAAATSLSSPGPSPTNSIVSTPAPTPTLTLTTAPPTLPATTAPAAPPVTAAAPPAAACSPRTSSGNCYKPGEFCPKSDHDASGVAGDGENITCENNDGWRWEPA